MNFLEQETGDSPLHLALRYKRKIDAENHLRRGADPNFPNAHGDTPLHIICRRISDSSDLAKMVFELSDKSYYPVQVNAQNDLDETPLHLAISCMYNSKKMVELLLRMGANPNLANAKGSTPLHIISKKCYTDDLVSLIFRFRDERYHPVQVDAMDEEGNTPLHVALKESNKEAARSLLKNGADPNLATTYGLTPLYICCDRQSDIGLADMLFKICDDKQRPVDVDATNRWNNTPLHAAAFHDHKDLVKLLITRGADPNIANLRGSTPLHWICAKCCDTDVAKIFFAVCDKKHRSVQVNVRDNLGRTPLELAVKNLLIHVVDLILDHGATLSSFVFPKVFHFNRECYAKYYNTINIKLIMTSSLLAIVDRLWKNQCRLDTSDHLMIMRFFAKHGLFEKSEDLTSKLAKRWLQDEKFTSRAKGVLLKEDEENSKTLLDLTKLSPDELVKELAYKEYLDLARSKKLTTIPKRYHELCAAHLCEKLARKFFRRWALEPFMKLTHSRLPILCCDMIIEGLKNEDLYNICLTAESLPEH